MIDANSQDLDTKAILVSFLTKKGGAEALTASLKPKLGSRKPLAKRLLQHLGPDGHRNHQMFFLHFSY